uniref:hypothetical protein n=1 Tax=Altererythrobacter segetis TaxID=1104773 RepID=UPI00140B5B51|nr:hypothetical protein [Altererythrobacter segetis]
MKRLVGAISIPLVVAFAMPAAAQTAGLQAADEQAVDALISPVIASLKGNSTGAAVATYLKTNKLGAFDDATIKALAEKVDEGLAKYGPAVRCDLLKEEERDQLVAKRTYLCQHQKALTRWTFIAAKLPDGWAAWTFSYDTKIEELF